LLLMISPCRWDWLRKRRVAVLGADGEAFPVPIQEYVEDERGATLIEMLRHRIEVEPFNLAATLIFICAILHTFMAPRILRRVAPLQARA
jgi:hypothetical protein